MVEDDLVAENAIYQRRNAEQMGERRWGFWLEREVVLR